MKKLMILATLAMLVAGATGCRLCESWEIGPRTQQPAAAGYAAPMCGAYDSGCSGGCGCAVAPGPM
jgi:hypothetical protein